MNDPISKELNNAKEQLWDDIKGKFRNGLKKSLYDFSLKNNLTEYDAVNDPRLKSKAC